MRHEPLIQNRTILYIQKEHPLLNSRFSERMVFTIISSSAKILDHAKLPRPMGVLHEQSGTVKSPRKFCRYCGRFGGLQGSRASRKS